MKQIIVPTDFSKGAWNALTYAVDLGERLEIRDIMLLNSYQAPHSGASTLASIDRIMQKDSEDGLENLIHKIKDSGMSSRVNFHHKSIHSSLEKALNSQIEDYNDSLVVIGSKGESGTVEKIFGSNASDVALNAHCPVIIIPPQANFTNCGNVVLASDFDQVADRNLKILRTITALEPSTILQIVHVQKDYDSSSSKASMGLDQSDIPHAVKDIPGEDIIEAIDKYAIESDTDLLVLIRRDSGFFDHLFHHSITKKLALLSHVPLLVLKG